MKLNENGKMTVYMVGHGETKYEIEKPKWLSSKGWKEFVGLFSDDKIWYHDDVHMILTVLSNNIEDNKDTGKDLIHSLQLSIVGKIFEIHTIKDLIKSSEFYKSGEIKDIFEEI